MSNVYESCPVIENGNYILRLMELEDVDDLLAVYGDKRALPYFNSDNCGGGNFYCATIENMREAIRCWLIEYERKGFVRFTIIAKSTGKAVGTIELFKRTSTDSLTGCGMLRLDVRGDHEERDVLFDVLSIIVPPAFELFECETIATKAPIYAVERIEALKRMGFEKSDDPVVGQHDGRMYYDYWLVHSEG